MKNDQKTNKDDFVLDALCKSYKRPAYNGLLDPNLSSFFASPRRRKLLVVQKLILPNGQINEKVCDKRITEMFHTSNPLKKSNLSEVQEAQRKSKSNTPNVSRGLKISIRSEDQGKVQPVSGAEFREMLSRRRELVKNL